ncbi:MAG: hypothetical protein KJ550_03845 [Proteobacteria bacterium]|nr:hypothetical protein [Pseudomonadota bacterium]MBU4068303.1 hypothetical protein [Pseudomonadota bacterium]
MRLNAERARMLNSSFQWIHFVLRNTDIATFLNNAPLVLKFIDESHFTGKVFGVNVKLNVLGNADPKPNGEIHIVTDARMPAGIGRTHTVAHYRYQFIDNNKTMVDLQFDLETVGPLMAIYMWIIKKQIDSYINKIMSHNEKAAKWLEDNDPLLQQKLTEGQILRIENYRKKLHEKFSPDICDKEINKAQEFVKEKLYWDRELSELTELYQQFQGKTNNLEHELIRIRETRDTVATLLITRRMLELIVTNVCEKSLNYSRGTEPMAGVIDKISRAKSIPDYVITSMINLNRLSSYGAHPKEFLPRQVREALIALCSIVEWYATYTKI